MLYRCVVLCQKTNSRETITRHRSVSRESSTSEDSDTSDVFLNDRPNEKSMRPDEMLASSTFYFLFAALFCCSFYANMFYNLYKTFAETFIDDDFFLARAFAIGSTVNAVARVGWGYLTDRTSFQVFVASFCVLTYLTKSFDLSNMKLMQHKG
ncbi:unnamed protein product [Strongylus vulgaris]|uniref:Uncharacterized protein n=1 Tax=Strongylus vulgaris TaxID=40348 RepID=A0A3P7J701_STRVU|nr:unnamed protein product [Strongylus vulgaris]